MTCLNDLNLGSTFNIRLFDTFKMYISEYAGTVLSDSVKKTKKLDGLDSADRGPSSYSSTAL